MITLDQANPSIELVPGYFIKASSEGYVILILGAKFGSAAAAFRHPSLLGSVATVHEYKRSTPTGAKFWTRKAGINHYLAFRKESIELIPVDGCSFPELKINGERVVLNASGGSSPSGWTDYIARENETMVGYSPKILLKLAAAAISPDEALKIGATVDLSAADESADPVFRQALAKQQADKVLKPGYPLRLRKGLTFDGSAGPLYFENKGPGGTFICSRGASIVRVKKDQIDWNESVQTQSSPGSCQHTA